MNLFERYKRWRHGHGFGVHSPLAYDIITSVLKDYPGYYSDEEINKFYCGKRERRIARIILRLITRFEPRSVFVDNKYKPAVKLSDSRIQFPEAPHLCGMEIKMLNDKTVIRVGEVYATNGPLILSNLKDLEIVIYRKGVSPQQIITNL